MRPAESFVGQPVRSLQTMLRTISERYTELPTLIPDGIYGPQTMRAVTAFQRRAGIPITGVTDLLTWNTVVAEFLPASTQQIMAAPIQALLGPSQVITAGEYSPYLYLAQAMLLAFARECRVFPAPPVTGILDPDTAKALRSFQKLSGLPATGDLDKITWKHLTLQYTLNADRLCQGLTAES